MLYSNLTSQRLQQSRYRQLVSMCHIHQLKVVIVLCDFQLHSNLYRPDNIVSKLLTLADLSRYNISTNSPLCLVLVLDHPDQRQHERIIIEDCGILATRSIGNYWIEVSGTIVIQIIIASPISNVLICLSRVKDGIFNAIVLFFSDESRLYRWAHDGAAE